MGTKIQRCVILIAEALKTSGLARLERFWQSRHFMEEHHRHHHSRSFEVIADEVRHNLRISNYSGSLHRIAAAGPFRHELLQQVFHTLPAILDEVG